MSISELRSRPCFNGKFRLGFCTSAAIGPTVHHLFKDTREKSSHRPAPYQDTNPHGGADERRRSSDILDNLMASEDMGPSSNAIDLGAIASEASDLRPILPNQVQPPAVKARSRGSSMIREGMMYYRT